MYQTGKRRQDSMVLRSMCAPAVQFKFPERTLPPAFDAGKTHVIVRGTV